MGRKCLRALAAALVFGAANANAQGWQSHTTEPAAPPKARAAPLPSGLAQKVAAKPALPQPAAQQIMLPQIHLLVRTTLLTLNDANRTGNYTVLRDLGAPSFRERNSAAELSQIFAEMRRARLDLTMAALLTPELDEPPSLDGERRLRLKGTLPTEPNRVVFDVVFEAVAGHWQLFGVSIATRPARSAAGGPAPPPAR